MAFRDVWVNGTLLNNGNTGVDGFTGRRQLPNRAAGGVTAPDLHGVVRYRGSYEPNRFSLDLWVDGRNPVTGAYNDEFYQLLYERAIDRVQSMFSSRNGTFTIETERALGQKVRATCRLVGDVQWTEAGELMPMARAKVPLEIPSVWWEGDAFSTTIPVSSSNFPLLVDDMGGALIDDAKFVITGPIVNPRIESGSLAVPAFLQFNGNVPAGNSVTIDSSNWSAWRNATTTTSVVRDLSYGGGGSRFMVLSPDYSVRFTGTSTTSATKLTVSGTKKYL